MARQLITSLKILLIFTLLTGILYPLIITRIAQVMMPDQANGSLIVNNGKILGSKMIGQYFDDPKYFWGRPSATNPAYNASASAGSNLGPTSKVLSDVIKGRVEALRLSDLENKDPVPADLVMASASGMDPHISVEAARYQAGRIAKARKISKENILKLIDQNVEGRFLLLFGQPRVNVLRLNLLLDKI